MLSNNVETQYQNYSNHGAWYIHPSKWGERFDNISDPKSIEFVKTRKMTEIEKQKRLAAKEEAAAKEVLTYSQSHFKNFFFLSIPKLTTPRAKLSSTSQNHLKS